MRMHPLSKHNNFPSLGKRARYSTWQQGTAVNALFIKSKHVKAGLLCAAPGAPVLVQHCARLAKPVGVLPLLTGRALDLTAHSLLHC